MSGHQSNSSIRRASSAARAESGGEKGRYACVQRFSELGLVYERIARSAIKQANLDFL